MCTIVCATVGWGVNATKQTTTKLHSRSTIKLVYTCQTIKIINIQVNYRKKGAFAHSLQQKLSDSIMWFNTNTLAIELAVDISATVGCLVAFTFGFFFFCCVFSFLNENPTVHKNRWMRETATGKMSALYAAFNKLSTRNHYFVGFAYILK